MSLSVIKRATMGGFSPKSNTRYHVRSISLPPRSHPTTVRVEQVLTKLQRWEASSSSSKAETICIALPGLEELHKSIEELLNLPLTQQALSQHQPEKWVKELLEGSVAYIDVCSNTRDAIMLIKEAVREIQSALRRRKVGDFNIESNINAYIFSRKMMKKDISKSLAALKHADQKFSDLPLLHSNSNSYHHLSATLRVLREASLMTISILQLILLYLAVPVSKPKCTTRWSLVSRLGHKGFVASEGQQKNLNELENVDIELSILPFHETEEAIQSAQRRLEALDAGIQSLEGGLEGLFRRLINARVSLLNILSQ